MKQVSRHEPSVLGLTLLFGMYYFVQGIGEPSEGLIAQPIRSLLASWGCKVAEITAFMGYLALPWALKPIYGLFTDFVPIFGSRRKSYLVLTGAVASGALLAAYYWQPTVGEVKLLFWLLLLPSAALAFGDVAVDALMVEVGQPRKLTGQFQSFQWGSIWAASILTGFIGGYLSEHHREMDGLLICGLATLVSLTLSITVAREPSRQANQETLRERLRTLARAFITPSLISPAAFLFLWNFNPFSLAVLQDYMTTGLGMSQWFYGATSSLGAIGAMVASFAYRFYCRRVSMRVLVHASIALGVASNLCYWALQGEWSAGMIRIFATAASATAVLIQLDLAARVCPPKVAGTIFALLMSISNYGVASSMVLGGKWHAVWLPRFGPSKSFHLLVGVGALFTAGCWLLVPFMRFPAASSNDNSSQVDEVNSSGT